MKMGNLTYQPFKVIEKETGVKRRVFAVKIDKNGYPRFLVYVVNKNSWIWVKAKHFKPIDI